MREVLKQKLVDELKKHNEILGCFEGGSAAFQRDDEWSDLDLQIIVMDDFVEQAIIILENTLKSIAPIEDKYILPQPAWHGQWQGFYKLRGVSPYLMLDVLIMKESSPSYFTEVEMHGTPIVFFDKTGRIGNEHINSEELFTTISNRIRRAENITRMFNLMVEKEILRHREVDAFDLYYNLFLRTLVELLRIKYDPARWSFGLRYLSFALPPKVYEQIKSLLFVANPADLKAKQDKVLKMMSALLDEMPSVKGQ
jgi:hypothetical protein